MGNILVKETSPLVVATAIVSLIGLALFIFYMLRHISAQEIEWTRAIYLLTGVEAVAFAAAGYLFGKDVNRVRAENAEEEVDKCREIASNAQKIAVEAETKGKSLALLIITKANKLTATQAKSPAEGSFTDLYTSSIENSLFELADVAAKQFLVDQEKPIKEWTSKKG